MSNDIKEIQIQTIIDTQTFLQVKKCIESVLNALRVCGEKNMSVEATMRIGILEGWAYEKELHEFLRGKNENIIVESCGQIARYRALHDLIARSNAKYDLIIYANVIMEAESIYRMLCNSEIDNAIIEARQTPIELAKEYDEKTGVTEWASDVCMIMPHKLYCEINGFDFDRFYSFYGNIDLCLRARLKGHFIIYDPSIMVYNPVRIDKEGCVYAQEDDVTKNRDKLFFLDKWGNERNVIFLCNALEKEGKNEAVKLYKKDKLNIVERDGVLGKKNYINLTNYDFCDVRF